MPSPLEPHAAVPALLRTVWERNLPVLRERLDHLDHIAACILTGTLSPEDRALALANAHKLVGSLGTFGYPAGSELCRSVERLLETSDPADGPQLQRLVMELRSILTL